VGWESRWVEREEEKEWVGGVGERGKERRVGKIGGVGGWM
jgi:hypothetical protein